MSVKIAPSVLAADFGNLERDIKMINSSKADWFHLDIMDGLFVPNISFGMPVVESISKIASKPLDVHLMIMEPDRYIEIFANLGTKILTVHYEACNHLHRSIQKIKDYGMKAGVALNPHTNINLLSDTIVDIDLVCLMSVNPGFGGQTFIQNTYNKVRELRQLIDEKVQYKGRTISMHDYYCALFIVHTFQRPIISELLSTNLFLPDFFAM